MRLVTDTLGYVYPAGVVALRDVSVALQAGERVLVTGPSGCGKSTFLRLCAGLLQRHGSGVVTGTVRIDGTDPITLVPRERPARVGFVCQEPADMLVTGTVADEVAFGPESAGWEASRVDERISAVLQEVGLDVSEDRSPETLSGGQTQRLAIAAALAADARLLLLDEPLSQLDPVGANRLLARLATLAENGVTVVIAEHRLERSLPWADRVLRFAEGRLVQDAAADQVTAEDLRGLQTPIHLQTLKRRPPPHRTEPGPELFSETVSHYYGDRCVLDAVAVSLSEGERVAIVGVNGAGKSTLLGCLRDQGLAIPQNPDLTLFSATVGEELAYGPSEKGESLTGIREIAGALRLDTLLDRSPQGLSRGQRLRTAVGAGLTCRPKVLLLDEPTAGQDRDAVQRVFSSLGSTAVLFATHDLDLVLRWAHRVIWLHDGNIRAVGTPQEVLEKMPLEMLPATSRECRARGWPYQSSDQEDR